MSANAISDGVKALEVYKKAFNATELFRRVMPAGRLGHGAIRIGAAVIILSAA